MSTRQSNHLILVTIIVSFALLPQIGCQEPAPDTGGGSVQQNQELLVPSTAAPYGGESAEQPQQERPLQLNKPKLIQAETVKRVPRITFEQKVHHFGEVGPATRKTAEFRFTNTGDALLEIQRVQRCCGAVTKLAKKRYAPGESGVLEVTYAFASKPMTMSKQVHVYTNDPQQQKVSLTIIAKVVCKVDCNPKKLQLFLDRENAGAGEITLTSLDGRPFSIAGFSCTGNVITADFDPSAEATKFILASKVDIEKAQKRPKGLIDIRLTHPDGKHIGLRYELLSHFTVDPSVIVILPAEPEKPIIRRISVLNNYGKDFEIGSVSSKGNTVAIEVLEQKKIRNGYQLDVEITPPAAEGNTKFTDTFSINLKGGEKLAVTCNGYYSKSSKSRPKTK